LLASLMRYTVASIYIGCIIVLLPNVGGLIRHAAKQ
jgi:hypothetical protein